MSDPVRKIVYDIACYRQQSQKSIAVDWQTDAECGDMRAFLISSAALLLWVLVISPVLCGLFGTPLPINLRERRIVMRGWSFSRYFWLAGILSLGTGIALASGLNYYLEWQNFNYAWLRPSVDRVVSHAAFWLVFGAVWAWATWDKSAGLR